MIRLREFGQNCFSNSEGLSLKEDDYVIIEHDRGLDYGQVICLRDGCGEAKDKEQVKKISRVATAADLRQIEGNKEKSKNLITTCLKKIEEHKLDMKLVQAEYSFDRSKIIFYFTAEGRVDFRGLLRDLAKIFRARIELVQIGVRDEARFFGGFGPCGRELCCATFLRYFEPVTIKMAKEQGLPLNPPKISGLCGRLMCCIYFEDEKYKTLPNEGEIMLTARGKGKVKNKNVAKRTVTVELEDGTQIEVKYK